MYRYLICMVFHGSRFIATKAITHTHTLIETRARVGMRCLCICLLTDTRHSVTTERGKEIYVQTLKITLLEIFRKIKKKNVLK